MKRQLQNKFHTFLLKTWLETNQELVVQPCRIRNQKGSNIAGQQPNLRLTLLNEYALIFKITVLQIGNRENRDSVEKQIENDPQLRKDLLEMNFNRIQN